MPLLSKKSFVPATLPVLPSNPPLNSKSPVTAASTYAFVAASCASVGLVTFISLFVLISKLAAGEPSKLIGISLLCFSFDQYHLTL